MILIVNIQIVIPKNNIPIINNFELIIVQLTNNQL